MASIVKKVITSLVEQVVKPMYLAVMSRAFLLRKVTILVLLALGIAFSALCLALLTYCLVIYPQYFMCAPIYLVCFDLMSR